MASQGSEGKDYGRQSLEEMGLTWEGSSRSDEPASEPAPEEPVEPPERAAHEERRSEPPSPASPPSSKARIGLILSILAVPAALLPILGFGLGVAAIVLGVRARGEAGRPGVGGTGRATAAIVVGAVAVLLSIGSFVVGLSQVSEQREREKRGALPARNV